MDSKFLPWFSLSNALVALVFLLLGVALGLIGISLEWVHLGHELAIGNLVQATVTLFAALLVTLVLQKRAGDHSKKKDLFIKQLEQVVDMLSELEESDFPKNLVSVNQLLKKIRCRCNSIRSCGTYCKFPKELCDELTCATHIKVLRRLATDTPVHKMCEDGAAIGNANVVKEGVISLGEEMKLELHQVVEKMRNEILVLQLRINFL